MDTRRDRRAYRWFLSLDRSIAGKALVLLLLIGLAVALFGLVAWALLPSNATYGDGVNWTINNLLNPSQITQDSASTAGRVLGVIVILSGLVLVIGGMLTLISDSLLDTLERSADRIASVPIPVDADGHVLFIGWHKETDLMLKVALDEVAEAEGPVPQVVVLAPSEAQDEVLACEALEQADVLTVFGDPRSQAALRACHAERAKTIFVLATIWAPRRSNLAADNLLTAIAVEDYLIENGASPLLMVELRSESQLIGAEDLFRGEVMLGAIDRTVTVPVINALMPSGFRAVYRQLGIYATDFELRSIPATDFSDRRIEHVERACLPGIVIGVKDSGDHSDYLRRLPPPGAELSPKTVVITFGARNQPLAGNTSLPPMSPDAEVQLRYHPPVRRHVLILGWGPATFTLLRQMARGDGIDWSVSVLSRMTEADIPEDIRQILDLRLTTANVDPGNVREILATSHPDIALVLPETDVGSLAAAEADALTRVLNLRQLSDVPILTWGVSEVAIEALSRIRDVRTFNPVRFRASALLRVRSDVMAFHAIRALHFTMSTLIRFVTLECDSPVSVHDIRIRVRAQGQVLLGVLAGEEVTAPGSSDLVASGTTLVLIEAADDRPDFLAGRQSETLSSEHS